MKSRTLYGYGTKEGYENEYSFIEKDLKFVAKTVYKMSLDKFINEFYTYDDTEYILEILKPIETKENV